MDKLFLAETMSSQTSYVCYHSLEDVAYYCRVKGQNLLFNTDLCCVGIERIGNSCCVCDSRLC